FTTVKPAPHHGVTQRRPYSDTDRRRLCRSGGITVRKLMSDFALLLEAEIPRLRRYALALTRDRSRGDDLVQSCLTRALTKRHLWQEGTDLRAWLFTILHNQHVNEVRRSAREGFSVPVEDLESVLTAR